MKYETVDHTGLVTAGDRVKVTLIGGAMVTGSAQYKTGKWFKVQMDGLRSQVAVHEDEIETLSVQRDFKPGHYIDQRGNPWLLDTKDVWHAYDGGRFEKPRHEMMHMAFTLTPKN